MRTPGKGELLKRAKHEARNDTLFIFNKRSMNSFCDQAIEIGIRREREAIIRFVEKRAKELSEREPVSEWAKIKFQNRPAMAIVLQTLAEEMRLRDYDPELLRELREGEIDVEVTL